MLLQLNGNPLISVITVSLNEVKDIEKTIQSVTNQTFYDIEFIIIDGSSDDGTIEIIKKYEKQLTYWISEPDKGLYYAMNKGIDLATGKYLNFLNAGDYFISDSILETISDYCNGSNEIIYGDSQHQKAESHEYLWKRMVFNHQTAFIKNTLIKKKKYDVKYKILADYNFFVQQYLNGAKFKNSELLICNFKKGGLSETSYIPFSIEAWRIALQFGNKVKIHYSHLKRILTHYKKKYIG